MCGGTGHGERCPYPVQGLSPRVRGNRTRLQGRAQSQGSIPACAGEPSAYRRMRREKTVYPRVCGGTSSHCIERCHHQRVYPRVCGGTRQWLHSFTMMLRSIPACAGEPTSFGRLQLLIGVYPRVCGGTSLASSNTSSNWGLSPRVRGNRQRGMESRFRSGSIPACAGEPLAN